MVYIVDQEDLIFYNYDFEINEKFQVRKTYIKINMKI